MILLNCWPATRDIYIYKTKQNIEGRRARKARSSFPFFVRTFCLWRKRSVRAQELVTLVRITRILNQFDHDSVIYGRERDRRTTSTRNPKNPCNTLVQHLQ